MPLGCIEWLSAENIMVSKILGTTERGDDSLMYNERIT